MVKLFYFYHLDNDCKCYEHVNQELRIVKNFKYLWYQFEMNI